MENVERQLIVDALARAGGVQVRAARLLGITEQSLWYRMKKFAIVARVDRLSTSPTSLSYASSRVVALPGGSGSPERRDLRTG
jgi:Bacterial regulatory protein, Fis family